MRALGVVLVVSASAVAVVLRLTEPAWFYGDAGHDDQLFARGASALLQGEWLGPYDNRTLIKGPAYSFFLAATYATHVPYLLALVGVQLVAAGALATAVARTARSAGLGVLLFTALALDPSQLGAAGSRVSRDAWYSSICLLLFALAIAVARACAPKSGVSARHLVALSLLCGAVLVLYALGREERLWLVPSLAVVALAVSRGRRNSEDRTAGRRTAWRMRGLALSVVAVVLATGVGTVAMINQREYGARVITDLAEGEFARAYGAWQSVRAGSSRPFVPINAAQRTAVYDISASANEMQPFLENDVGGWRQPGCAALRVCDDFAAGWLPYALRDAAASTGHFDDAASAQRFYRRVADDIAAGCRSGTLECGKPLPLLLPPLEDIDIGAVAAGSRASLSHVIHFRESAAPPPLTEAAPANYELFRRAIRGLPPSVEQKQAQERRDGPASGAAGVLGTLYMCVAFIALIPALVGYITNLRPRSWSTVHAPELVWIGLAAGLACAVRAALLGLIDATSFPAAKTGYTLPSTGFLIVFLAIGLWLLVGQFAARSRHAPIPVGP